MGFQGPGGRVAMVLICRHGPAAATRTSPAILSLGGGSQRVPVLLISLCSSALRARATSARQHEDPKRCRGRSMTRGSGWCKAQVWRLRASAHCGQYSAVGTGHGHNRAVRARETSAPCDATCPRTRVSIDSASDAVSKPAMQTSVATATGGSKTLSKRFSCHMIVYFFNPSDA